MKNLESRARRLARKLDWKAVKSRWRKDSIDNHGGFQLIDDRNTVVDGAKFDLSATEVIDICQQRLEAK